MENHIKNNSLETLSNEYTVLIHTLEKVRFVLFMVMFFYIVISELKLWIDY